MTIATVPSIFYEFAFNADPNQNTLPPYWTDLSSRVQFGWKTTRGRQYELDANETGVWSVELANADGALDPNNTGSPFAPNILPYRQCRIRVVVGNNLLIPDQASAGEYAPLNAGPAPAATGVTGLNGSLATVASVGGSAYGGTRVWATTVPSGTAGADLLGITVQQITPGQIYTFSGQAQATTVGQNPAVYLAVNWIGIDGATVSTSSGSPSTLTGAAGTWTALSVTAAAPAAAVAAQLRVVTTTTPSANSTIWTDALQLEDRGYATRWQMPWMPSVNLLPQTIATGTETMSGTDQIAGWFYAAGGTIAPVSYLATAAPPGQSTAVAWTLPAGSYGASPALYVGANAAYPGGPVADCAQVTAGQTYTGSVYVSRTGTDPTVTVASGINWFDSAGNVLPGSFSGNFTVPTSGWTRVSVIHAAPAGAVWGRMFIYMSSASLAATETIYATGWQFEQASGATTWADPGPATFLFTGMVERWPETWVELDGTYGTSHIECVDAFAGLAQPRLASPFVNELLSLGPNFMYLLNDPAGATQCSDASGRRPPAPIENSPYGVGSLTLGSSVTATVTTSAFQGAPGPVATFANSAATTPSQQPETFVSLHKATVTPGPPSSGSWTRMVAFRASVIPPSGGIYTIWSSQPDNGGAGSLSMSVQPSTGILFVSYHDTFGHPSLRYLGTGSICDGNWHLIGITVEPSSGNGVIYLDGVQVATGTSQGSPGVLAVDTIGAYVIPSLAIYQAGMVGDVACAVELPFVANAAQISTLYNSWRTASAGESTGSRYARVLRWIGWSGPTAIDAGSTTSMGPATDTAGQSALNGLNLIAATENGDQYASAAGVLTFKGRSALYGARIPQVVFGEGRPVGNAGEWPCEVGAVDFDPAHLANQVAITQYQGSTFSASDAVSEQRFFPRQYTRTVNTMLSSEALDAATYLTSQLKDPRQRAEVIRLHPSAVMGLFPALAQVDKNARARLIKRPIGSPPITIDGYIQRIAWSCTPDSDFWVEYQASSADLAAYWQMGALHTTLSAQASSGQNHATINALPDAAVNKLAQSLPAGYTLTFEPGTARTETVAIAAGGIPSTSLGYATATLTMASNLAFTHPAGSVVCEALPSGSVNPTAWDAASVLGAAYTPITSPGGNFGLGPNQLPIGPLSDAAWNSLILDWRPGQTLWISPGTARFQTAVISSVPTTFPGWTIAILTFTTNLSTWNFGDYVCEPLPAGLTSPVAINPTARVAY